MPYSDAVLRRAKARLAQAKADREQENAEHLAKAYAEHPRLAEIDRRLRATAAQAVAAGFRRGEDPTVTVAALREENLELQREREWILSDYEEGYLDNAPVCTACGGSGYVGAVMCSCLQELCRQEQKRELTSLFITGQEQFRNFKLDYYPDQADPDFGVSPRQMMELIYNRCLHYAQDFGPASGSMLFTGGPGLGKTFLSACIARLVADSGFSVVYDTAIRLFSGFEDAKFGENTAENRTKAQKYLDCDLLIIDDLGTEMTTQFTVSALYTVVNTRLQTGRATIISTNLKPEALHDRYSPQIASRVLGVYQIMQFLGTDIRQRR